MGDIMIKYPLWRKKQIKNKFCKEEFLWASRAV